MFMLAGNVSQPQTELVTLFVSLFSIISGLKPVNNRHRSVASECEGYVTKRLL